MDVRLGVDGRHADQQVRGAMVLPHGTGKEKKVLVFAKGPKATEAEQAGADFVTGLKPPRSSRWTLTPTASALEFYII